MASTSAEVDLLGEPRLKNGLTYYPGVQTEKGSVILGNVVRLQLQAEGALPYIGYGFLKGLWLWRDQPYIRVQYMAPSRTDLPKDAIAFRQEPDPTQMLELMVTNRVGDLHLNALLGPVFIEGGPLLSQLFQENVGADADALQRRRRVDVADALLIPHNLDVRISNRSGHLAGLGPPLRARRVRSFIRVRRRDADLPQDVVRDRDAPRVEGLQAIHDGLARARGSELVERVGFGGQNLLLLRGLVTC